MEDHDRACRERGLRAAVLAGDEAAWRAWYEASFAGLYAYVVWRLGGENELADEIVQETWLTAVRRIRTFDPARASFAVWIRGIAANTLRNHWRKRKATPTASAKLQEAAGASADLGALKLEQAQSVAFALAQLPDNYEAVLRAKYLEQKPVAQIADEWGASAKMIESLLTRARKAFRQIYLERERCDETNTLLR
jgi:RNA polymerase sigma-70 factor (ECF subfamily)